MSDYDLDFDEIDIQYMRALLHINRVVETIKDEKVHVLRDYVSSGTSIDGYDFLSDEIQLFYMVHTNDGSYNEAFKLDSRYFTDERFLTDAVNNKRAKILAKKKVAKEAKVTGLKNQISERKAELESLQRELEEEKE